MRWLKKVAAKVAARKEQFGILVAGYLGNWAVVYSFDFVLYPWVIYKLGILQGGVVMFFASLLICLLTLEFYRWAKKDWLGIEALKGLRDNGKEGESKATKIFIKILRKGDWAAFLILSLRYDPFITTIYMQKGSHQYEELSKRDWKIFLGSMVIGNLYWIGVMGSGVELVKYLATIWKEVL
jgi:hypothetical protein